jgi:HrpA-like RNA helicase
MDIINSNIDDILDIEGTHPNFITGNKLSDDYIGLAKKWSTLPMYKDKSSVKKFFNLLHNSQVILLISGTGSGKTVLVPKFVFKYIKTMNMGGKIAITNPKILTTIYNAEYGAKTLDVKLGEEVGYKFKGAPKEASSSKSKLLYLTDGLILAIMMGGDNLLSEYQCVIIDEAHERHVQIDILMKMIKDMLKLRPDFKLIIMSATINADVFRNYFNIDGIKYGEIEVSGESNFPIKQNWLSPSIKVTRMNYMNLAVDRCLDILNTSESGDILVFVPTQRDTSKGCQMLKTNCPKTLKSKIITCDKLYCVEVYSKMNQENKDMAVSKDLYKTKGFGRKILFATNVAESSITFDGLVYVVDTGFELAHYYDANENSTVVSTLYTSQAQVKQRIGRAGRTQNGIAYHLYSNKDYDKFKLYPSPNISVIDLADFILGFIKYTQTMRHMIELIKGFITIPTLEQISYAIHKLHFIKCLKIVEPNKDSEPVSDSESDSISESTQIKSKQLKFDDIKWDKILSYEKLSSTLNGALSIIGLSILSFKSTPILSALAIIMSKYMNCQIEMTQIMAMIEISDGKIDTLFDYDRKDVDTVISYFADTIYKGSDHLTLLNIYIKHYKEKSLKYLNKKLFDMIDKRQTQLLINASSIKATTYEYILSKYNLINAKPYTDIQSNILYVLAMSHYYNLLSKDNKNMYTSINFMENTTALVEYCKITSISSHTNFVICHSLSNVFGRKSFNGISQIPDSIIKDISLNETLYNTHLAKFKKL